MNKITKITAELYEGTIKIDFFPESHRYKLAGEKSYLISVTSCTGIIDKSRFLIPWAVGLAGQYLREYLEKSSNNNFTIEELLPVIDEACKQHTIKKEEAASTGEKVHKWVELFAKAKMDNTKAPDIDENEDERVITGISAFLDWYNDNKVTFMETERLVYSQQYGFVGITDAIAQVNGKNVLIDYKTSKGLYSEMDYQVSAYRMAFEEESYKLDGAMILHFCKETGNFTVKYISNDDHLKNCPVFLACFEIKKREKEMAKI